MKKILVIMVLFAAFTSGFKTRKMANHPEKSE